MAMIDELHSQVDQGKRAVLRYKDGDKNIEISIRWNNQGHYTRTLSFPSSPNPFPQPQTVPYNSWKYLLEDLNEDQATNDQWHIE